VRYAWWVFGMIKKPIINRFRLNILPDIRLWGVVRWVEM